MTIFGKNVPGSVPGACKTALSSGLTSSAAYGQVASFAFDFLNDSRALNRLTYSFVGERKSSGRHPFSGSYLKGMNLT